MADNDSNRLFEAISDVREKLGGMREKIDGLDEKVDDMRNQTAQRHAENQGRFTELERNMQASIHDRSQIKEKLDGLNGRVGSIEKPVHEFVALRNKVGAWIGLITAVGFLIWFFVGPFWGVIEHKIIYWIFPGLRPNP